MMDHRFVLADRCRVVAFAALGEVRGLIRSGDRFVDGQGVAWGYGQVGGAAVGVTPLGPGWVWDPEARAERAADFARQFEGMRATPRRARASAINRVLACLRLGRHAGRVLWAVHRAVMATGTSLLLVPDEWLARAVWGQATRPRHWRGDLLAVLRGLTWLHVADWPDGGGRPDFGAGSVLLTHAGDLRGDELDRCPATWPMHGGPRHHHVQVETGPSFLGILAARGLPGDPAATDGRGVPAHAPQGARDGAALRRLGRTGRLVSIFLPAVIGEPAACARLTGP
jgi:hypothetical protein